jgi:peptidoglycan lytic transglycosylase
MSRKIKTGLLAYLLLPVAAFGREERVAGDSVQPQRAHHKPAQVKVQYGIASYYANKFEGRKTYTDEIFTQEKLTGASNTLPMRTWVKVTNLRNHRVVYVRINDKMHPRNKRIIDLSLAAARKLGYSGNGLTRVRIDVLGKKRPPGAAEEVAVQRSGKD